MANLWKAVTISAMLMVGSCSRGNQVTDRSLKSTGAPASVARVGPASPWKFNTAKDQITDEMTYEEATTNSAGQRLAVVCSGGDTGILLFDDGVISTGAQWQDVLTRFGQEKASSYKMHAARGVLVVFHKKYTKTQIRADLDSELASFGALGFFAEFEIAKTNNFLARYRQGDDDIDFSFDITGSDAAARRIQHLCEPSK